MGDRGILRSNGEGFKEQAARILLVDQDPRFRSHFADRLRRERCAEVVPVASLPEAERAGIEGDFDLVLYGNADWEAGILFYLDLLNRSRSTCKFILFIDDLAPVPPQLSGLVSVVRKPGVGSPLDLGA